MHNPELKENLAPVAGEVRTGIRYLTGFMYGVDVLSVQKEPGDSGSFVSQSLLMNRTPVIYISLLCEYDRKVLYYPCLKPFPAVPEPDRGE
jgi:hypothetical protein